MTTGLWTRRRRALAVALITMLAACSPPTAATVPAPSTPDPTASAFSPSTARPSGSRAPLAVPTVVGTDAPRLRDLVPGLPALTAPGWVRPGTRVSYYSAVANVLTSNERDSPDENGDWVGQTTGKRYRREELYGAAGHGVTQVDVLAVTPDQSALQVNSWQYSVYTGPLVPIGQAPLVGPAAGGDWYLHPDVLAQVPNQRSGGLTVLRMPYSIRGVTYHAIRIQQQDDRSTFAHVYDLTDGKLLALFGAVTSNEGTLFSEAIFLSTRQMGLPWIGGTLPSWVQGGRTLTYRGTKSWEAIRAGTTLTADLSLTMRIDDAGPDSFTYTRTTTATVPGYPAQTVQEHLGAGLGEPTSLILPPAALAGLRPGQVIDVDPVTGVTVKVNAVGNQSGRTVATLQAANRGYSALFGYDVASGAMLSYRDAVTSEETRQYTTIQLG